MLNSQQKALAAIKAGHFTSQILPIEVREGKTVRVFDEDEHPRDTPREKYAQLKPAFKKTVPSLPLHRLALTTVQAL